MRRMGKRIGERRLALGLTQAELARDIGVSQQTVAKWETGSGYGPVPKFVALAERLGCSLDALLADRQLPPPASVEEAVMGDERLTAEGRETVLRVYRSLAGLDG